MLPKTEKALVEQSLARYCEERIPAHAREKVRMTYRWRGNAATLIEERPYFQDPTRWTLYCADRNSHWHLYDEVKPAASIQTLLDEVSRDPTGIFWG